MAHITKRNPGGTVVSMTYDPLQLGFKVARITPGAADVTTGVRLYLPRPKCGACGHEPPASEPLVEVSWITPDHPIMGAVEPWCGLFDFGLQRPAEKEGEEWLTPR
jgi:hypothetical protein